MELEISKRYFSQSFHQILSNLYEAIAYHRESAKFYKYYGALNVNMEVNGKSYGISENKQKFGTRGTTVHI